MKKYSLIIMVTLPLFSMEYRKASTSDCSAVLDLINTQAVQESDKLVILPKKFREGALQEAIQKGRLFVATENNRVLGYKKLYMVSEEQEKYDLLHNELRCCGPKAECTYRGVVTDAGLFSQASINGYCERDNVVCLYDGSDFTVQEKRGRGINSLLTLAALQTILPEVQKKSALCKSASVALLYGLTCANAGDLPGLLPDRTMSIAKSFAVFIKKLTQKDEPVQFEHVRYSACMPTFDPESDACCPLPDKHSVKGFGCVLMYCMKDNHE